MGLTKKQEECVKVCIERYKEGERFSVIAGYAGTGKSFVVRHIVEALSVNYGINPDVDVCYCAFTGKACDVLKRKGNSNVKTLHKLLYNCIRDKNGKWKRMAKKKIEYKVLVVDEVSMVPKYMVELLASFNVYIIFLGDPFQLPPIKKDNDNLLLYNPHVFLNEIVRQAKDSEIIRLTMDIRDGKPIENYKGEDVIIGGQELFVSGTLKWADQIITATNKTRGLINKTMREYNNFDPTKPEEGDKIICTTNYWDEFSNFENPLINGTIGTLKNIINNYLQLPTWASVGKLPTMLCSVELEDGEQFSSISIDKNFLHNEKKLLNFKDEYRLAKSKKYKNALPLNFNYGYAITCHKSQGSQWDNVLVYEENFPFEKEEHARWLYTAATRSAKKLVLIKK